MYSRRWRHKNNEHAKSVPYRNLSLHRKNPVNGDELDNNETLRKIIRMLKSPE